MKTVSVGQLADNYVQLRRSTAGVAARLLAIVEFLTMEAERLDTTAVGGDGLRCLAREIEVEINELAASACTVK